jgi:hypothetical protein
MILRYNLNPAADYRGLSLRYLRGVRANAWLLLALCLIIGTHSLLATLALFAAGRPEGALALVATLFAGRVAWRQACRASAAGEEIDRQGGAL